MFSVSAEVVLGAGCNPSPQNHAIRFREAVASFLFAYFCFVIDSARLKP